VLAQTSTSIQVAEMLSLANDGLYPALELAPPQRRQRTLEALIGRVHYLRVEILKTKRRATTTAPVRNSLKIEITRACKDLPIGSGHRTRLRSTLMPRTNAISGTVIVE
jgi:hypothetical protein